MQAKTRDGAAWTRARAAATALARGGVTALFFALLVFAAAGCSGTTIQPGHRGLMFYPPKGLERRVLAPGFYRTPGRAHIDDFVVTYATHRETLHTLTSEALSVDVRFSVTVRPIIAELYELDTEVGPHYYDNVVAPEARAAWIAAIGSRTFMQVPTSQTLDAEVEASVRQRIRGKHIEISAVRLESITLDPAVAAALRDHAVRVLSARGHPEKEGRAPATTDGAKVPSEKNLPSSSE